MNHIEFGKDVSHGLKGSALDRAKQIVIEIENDDDPLDEFYSLDEEGMNSKGKDS